MYNISIYKVGNSTEWFSTRDRVVCATVLEDKISKLEKRVQSASTCLSIAPLTQFESAVKDLKAIKEQLFEVKTGLRSLQENTLSRQICDVTLQGKYYEFYLSHFNSK